MRSPFAFAEQQLLQFIISPHKLLINNKQLEGASLLNYGGDIYVPLRYITEQLGGSVGFDSKTGTISVASIK